MNIQNFKQMIDSQPQDKLIILLKNVRSKNAVEHENLILNVLSSKFPNWNKNKISGRTPNRAVFKNSDQQFNSAKDGFIWLVNQMIKYNSLPFKNKSPKLLEVSRSKQRQYLALSPAGLFFNSPHLAEDSTRFESLSYGWYLNVNLNNKLKFEVLARLSWLLGYKYGDDWNWFVHANTAEFYERREIQSIIESIYDLLRDK